MSKLIGRGLVAVERRPWNNAYAIHLIAYRPDNDGYSIRHVLTDIEMTAVADTDVLKSSPDTPLLIDFEMAQQFMDELWRAGIRPSEGNYTTGELKATQAHLQEMSGMTQRLLTAVLEK